MARTTRPVLIAAVLVAVLGAILWAQRRTAPLPPVFSDRLTMRQAASRSAESGKPVLVFATADWCGPCQQFKRTTLVDQRVEAEIREHFIPVYLNVDMEQDAAAVLSIHSIPASVILRDGSNVARLEGAVPGEQYLAWLSSNAPGGDGNVPARGAPPR